MKKALATGIAALAVAGGSVAVAAVSPFGAASAQTGSSSTTAPAAGSSGSATPAPRPDGPLEQALKALVADGTLTQAQADAVQAKLDALRPADGGGRHGRGEMGGPGMKAGAGLDEVATFLGISVDDLHTQLESGKTIAQIAGDKTQALIDSLVASANKRIDDAVTAGKLTADKATELKSQTTQRITDMVNNTMPEGGRGGHGHGPGFGPGGPGGAGGQPPASGSGGSAPATPAPSTTN